MTTSKKGNNRKKLFIALMAMFVVIATIFITLVFKTGDGLKNEGDAKITTRTQNEEIIYTDEVTVTVNSQEMKVEVPEELNEIFSENGFTAEKLEETECKQLVLVDSTEDEPIVRFFEVEENRWSENRECSGFVLIGRNGVTENKREGDGCTPLGFHKIGSAFYVDEKVETKLSCFKITEDSYWVDDPDSVHYNKYVEGTEAKDWNSAEHMIEYNGYRYGFVLDYNMECIPGAGSAIFFHIGSNPTAGCIATNEELLLKYLSLLDKDKNPYVLVV